MVFVCVSTIVQVLFDHNGCMKKYNTVTEILQEFYEVWRDIQRPMSSLHLCLFISLCVCCVLQVRLDVYRKRKAYLEGMLIAESAKLDSQAQFIMEIIEGKLVISKFI